MNDLIARVEAAVRDVNASYTPCLSPHLVTVNRNALDELLTAIRALRARQQEKQP